MSPDERRVRLQRAIRAAEAAQDLRRVDRLLSALVQHDRKVAEEARRVRQRAVQAQGDGFGPMRPASMYRLI